MPSLAPLFQGANWPEREVYDLMGITFSGHPDLRRILMPERWPNHPLRKDMPLGGEEVPFTLTWSDPEFESLGQQILPAESLPPTLPPGMNPQNMIINMGPHHPSTHGVLRLAVELDGETVLAIDPDLGYLHSGFEKIAEHRRYKDFLYYTDRMDYLSAMTNNLGFALAIEKLLGIEAPPRAQVIRVIMSELQRIAAHLFWLSTHTLDISGTGMSLLMYATRERELILDLFEMVCGARLTVSYMRVGGVAKDLPPAFFPHLEDFIRVFPRRLDDYDSMLTEGPMVHQRLDGIGKLSRAEAINMGLTGPMLRGSGVDWDLRRDVPYCGYETYEFKVPVSDRGDGYGRYQVRMEEMRQSISILQQAVARLPDGDYRIDDRKVTPPQRAETRHQHGGAHPPFQALHRGLPGAAGHGLPGHRVEQGRAGLFRLQRRLGQTLPLSRARAELQQSLSPSAP